MISIVTITYNAEKELPATLRSVAGQSYADYEHLIIDGASKDATVSIAENFDNPRLKVFSEPDKGLYDAMNKGLRMAKGDFILFLNAGDTFHDETMLERFAALATNDADIVYADTYHVNASREVVGKRHLSAPERLTFGSFSHGMLVCHQAFMVRRAIAPEYDLHYRFSADYDWTVRCIQRTTPERSRRLDCFAIDYLTDGLTDKNKIASLKERFRIMAHHYGLPLTLWRHLSFLRRLRRRRNEKSEMRNQK